MIRPVVLSDSTGITKIYNYYVSNSLVTFEEKPVLEGEMVKRIQAIGSSGLPWLVLEDNGEVVGYAYASAWKGRVAYRFSVEVTVYLANDTTGKGWGTQLYQALFSELAKKNIHAAIGGISLPNEASIALHEKLGMVKVAHFKEVGHKFDQWVDVGYWQKTFAD